MCRWGVGGGGGFPRGGWAGTCAAARIAARSFKIDTTETFANGTLTGTEVDEEGRLCLHCVYVGIDHAARKHYAREREAALWIDLGGEGGEA